MYQVKTDLTNRPIARKTDLLKNRPGGLHRGGNNGQTKIRRRSLHALGVTAVCNFSFETPNSGLLIPLFRHPETTRLRQSQSNRDSDAAVVEQIPNQKRFIPGDSAPSTSLPWAQPTLCRFCGGWHTNCAFLHIACLLSDVSLPSNPAATLRFGTFRSFPILRYTIVIGTSLLIII